MLSTAHTLISLPFGLYMDNPVLIFLSAFLFHLFCDGFLHWNIFPDACKKYPTFPVAIDIGIGIILSWILLQNQFFTLSVWAAIAGGNAPDILHELWNSPGTRIQRHFFRARSFFEFHKNIQIETRHITQGLIWQIVLVAIAIISIQIQLT